MLLLLLKRRFEGEGTNNRFSFYLSPKSCQGFLSQQSRGPRHGIHYIAGNDFSHNGRGWSPVHASVYPGGIIDARMDTLQNLEISSARDYDPRSWSAILGNHVQANEQCIREGGNYRVRAYLSSIQHTKSWPSKGLLSIHFKWSRVHYLGFLYLCQINSKNGTLGCILFHRFLCWMNERYDSSLHVHEFSFTVTNKTEYIVHKLNFGSHCQSIQIRRQSDEVINVRVQTINYINVKSKSKKGLGFLK